MTRAEPPIRTLKSVSIRRGDKLRVTGRVGDMEVTRVATFYKRDISQMGTDYLTRSGMSLFTEYRDGTSDLAGLKIQLLSHDPNEPVDVTLF